jgi:subtilisin family serine protease
MSRSHNRLRTERRRRVRLAAALVMSWVASLLVASTLAATPVHAPAEVRGAPGQFVVVALDNPVAGRPGAVGGTAHGYGSGSNYRVSPAAASRVRELADQYSLTRVSEWPIERLGMHCVLFRIPPGTTREAVIGRLRGDVRIRIVQPLNEFESATGATFDDPYAKLQSNVQALAVAEAHKVSRGNGVRVAVIDTGVDTSHPDLAGRAQLTRNYVDDDERTFRADRHGTQVAGVIAAAANNGIGIVGVAPGVKLMALKACWQPAATSAGRCNTFTIAQALADALSARAQVINLSLNGPGDPLLEALVNEATGAGVIVVGAASTDPRHVFPAGLPDVIAVAESEANHPLVDMLRAPARDIVTLVPDGHYDFASGSSLATAQVSGVAALLLARDRRLGAARLRELLEQSSRSHETARGPYRSVNACAALALLVSGAVC